MNGEGAGAGALLVRTASVLVPASRRREWLEEWLGELEALEASRSAAGGPEDPPRSRRLATPGAAPGHAPESQGPSRFPHPLTFALGAFPHALSIRKEEWTMDGVLQDLRYALRLLVRAPGFTLLAALTLALGIGANGAIFSLVNGLILRPPAGIAEPDRLVQIARSYDDAPRWDNWSWPALRLIREEARALSGVAGYQSGAFVLGRGAETEAVVGQYVTGDYFEVLGVRPFLGRLLRPDDDLEPGAQTVVVLGHGLWTRRYGGDPGIVGRPVELGARAYEVVGVAPPGFTGPETLGTPPALWVPATQRPGFRDELPSEQWGSSWINALGRLRDGVASAEAEASMRGVTRSLREASPLYEGILALLEPGIGLDPEGRSRAERVSLILLAIVGLVLLLTCTNVANLQLARATARRTEVGVRMALGAGRGRVARQLLTEGLLLAALATLLAVPVVLLAGRFLPLLLPFPLSVSVGADGWVFAFLGTVGLGSGLLFGAAPAWVASRRAPAATLRDAATTGGTSRTRLPDALVVCQFALSLGLVASAALLGRSVLNARAARPGFEPAGLSVGFLDLGPTGRYDEASSREFYSRVVASLEAVPGVAAATWANQVPLVGGHSRSTVRPADQHEIDGYEAESVVVGPRYFETMGIPILQGRALGGPGEEPEPVVVVNEALARMFWPGGDPVGQRLAGQGLAGGWRVVGMAGDVQMRSLREAPRPGVYYPLDHAWRPSGAVHARGEGGALPAAALREAVAAVDPELPVSSAIDLEGALSTSMGETRTIGWLVGAFALLALVLAVVGVYGLVSYSASQRVREMGIRTALGAEPGSLVRLILARGVALSVVGVAVGLGVALVLGRGLEGLLFGVAPADAGALGGAALMLLATAGLAAWVPARRASRVDAVVSLRD